MDLNSVIWHLLIISANGLAAVLWYLIVSTRKDVASLQKEVNLMKYNYLSRFDDIKDILKSFELNVIQRISILETLINKKG